MVSLERARLEDYLRSIETDGSETDHVQREAAMLFGQMYGRVRSARKIHAGRVAWKRLLHYLAYDRGAQ